MRERKSEIDKTYVIDENKWVLTMARKTTGSHTQHTFLIVEGIQDGNAVVWFMDLVGPGMSVMLPNLQSSRIRIESFSAQTEAELKRDPLLFRCERRMMDVRHNDTIAEQHWYIDRESALKLIGNITSDQNSPPIFNIIGKESFITGSSAKSSSKERGHNCFTYAREKIADLNIPEITVQCDRYAHCLDQIASVSSLTLKDPNRGGVSYCPGYKAFLAFGATVTAGVVLEAARRYYNTP